MTINPILKFFAPILAVTINIAGLAMAGQTKSFFFDREISENNSFAADPLGFAVDAAEFSFPVTESQFANLPVMITAQSHRDFDLAITVENATGDLCPDLELAAVGGANLSGMQSLSSFDYRLGSAAATSNVWLMSASLVPGIAAGQGRTCNFDLVFYGEQVGGGYSYRQIVKATVATVGNPQTGQTVASAETKKPVNEALIEEVGNNNTDQDVLPAAFGLPAGTMTKAESETETESAIEAIPSLDNNTAQDHLPTVVDPTPENPSAQEQGDVESETPMPDPPTLPAADLALEAAPAQDIPAAP